MRAGCVACDFIAIKMNNGLIKTGTETKQLRQISVGSSGSSVSGLLVGSCPCSVLNLNFFHQCAIGFFEINRVQFLVSMARLLHPIGFLDFFCRDTSTGRTCELPRILSKPHISPKIGRSNFSENIELRLRSDSRRVDLL